MFGVICYLAIFIIIAAFQIEIGADEALRPFGICRIIADSAIVFIPYVLLGRRWMNLSFLWWILFSLWLFSQMLYARTYHDVMPASSFFLVDNVDGILFDSIIGSIRIKDLILLLLMPSLWLAYEKYRKQLAVADYSLRRKFMVVSCVCALLFGFMAIEALKYYRDEYGRTTDSFWGRFTEPVVVGLNYVKVNGIFPYGVYALSRYLHYSEELSPDDMKAIDDFLDSCPASDYHGATSKGKNLILIVVESLNSWVVDFCVAGKEVCPILNALCHSDSSLTALSVVSQVGDGRSSDGHFIYNVGLLPLRSGSVAVKYGSSCAGFPSLARSLEGYSSVSVHCDSPSFWNNSHAFESYGFGKVLNKFDILQSVGDAHDNKVNDRQMFSAAIEALRNQAEPFYAQLITVSMHMPYNECTVPSTWISHDSKLPCETNNYLEKVHYFDCALGDFIASLRESGLYDNSVIAIASDHSEFSRDRILHPESNRAKIDDSLCMMVVVNSPIAMQVSSVVGQIDVYPTLLDIMGSDSLWRGIGHSMLDSHPVDFAVAKDGESYGNNKSAEQHLRQAWTVSEKIIRKIVCTDDFCSN